MFFFLCWKYICHFNDILRRLLLCVGVLRNYAPGKEILYMWTSCGLFGFDNKNFQHAKNSKKLSFPYAKVRTETDIKCVSYDHHLYLKPALKILQNMKIESFTYLEYGLNVQFNLRNIWCVFITLPGNYFEIMFMWWAHG